MLYSILLVGIFVFSAVGQPQWYPQRGAKLYRGGESSWIYTKWDAQFDTVWYTVEDRKSIVFSVKACSSAHVALSTVAGMTDFTIDVALGVVGNFRSQIRYPFEPGSMFQAETPNILHCNEYRTFWISWSLDYIEVGRGPSVGEQKFMNWFDTTLEQFTAIGFSSSEGHAALWEVKENSGDFVVLKTPDDHKYETFWKSVPDRQFYSFEVQACGDVHVILSEELGKQDANIYEFVIGGWFNNRSVIRTEVLGGGSTIKAQVDTVSIVNCNDYREFWVSWFNGTIEMGKGGVFGKNRVMRWRDPTPNAVRYLGLTTGFGNTGSWLLNDDLGGTNVIFTPKADESSPQNKYNTSWLETPRKKFVSFGVKSCAKAMILLSDIRSPDVEMAYEVQIGYEENTKSGVRMLLEQGYLVELQTPGILNCDRPSYFWMSWVNMTVRVGRGFVYDQAELFRFDIPPDYKIAALGLATGYAGEYRFRESMGDRLFVKTPDGGSSIDGIIPVSYEQYWRTVPTGQDFIRFRIKACKDAYVAITPATGIGLDEYFYSFTIGGWENTRSTIRRRKGYEWEVDVVDQKSTPNILDCNQFRDFYISWQDGTLTFGKSDVPGWDQIITTTFEYGYPVKAVAFDTAWGGTGEWILYEDTGDEFTYYTQGDPDFQGYWMTLEEQVTWTTVKVRSCKDAKVHLSTQQSLADRYFTIVFGAGDDKKAQVRERNQIKTERSFNLAIVECSQVRDFWISWDKGYIQVGFGVIYGSERFMEYRAQELDVNSIGFASENTAGRFQISDVSGYATYFDTPKLFNYGYVWRSLEHKEYLFVAVEACSDVHIGLSERFAFMKNYAYEVVVGGWHNTRSVIRSDDVYYADVNTPDILKCGNITRLWVSWRTGSIIVGKGVRIGQERLMDYQPVTPKTIRYVGFTSGYDYEAKWAMLLAVDPLNPPVTEAPTNPTYTDGPPLGLGGGGIAGVIFGVIIVIGVAFVSFFIINKRRQGMPSPSGTLPYASFSNPNNTSSSAPAKENSPLDSPTVKFDASAQEAASA